MDSFKDSLGYWSSILGAALGLLGLIESLQWLAISGLIVLAVSVGALFYAEKQRQRLKLAAIRIEGRSIDSLNLASLGRRLNRTLALWFSAAGAPPVALPADRRKVEPADVRQALTELGAQARYTQLRQQIMTLTECSKRTAQMAIAAACQQGSIVQADGHYSLPR
jgi:hypothetical protein